MLCTNMSTILFRYCSAKIKKNRLHSKGNSAAQEKKPLLKLEGASFAAHPREVIYEETAHVIIDTDGLSPDEVADEIIISAL